jgi:hypothetical protein
VTRLKLFVCGIAGARRRLSQKLLATKEKCTGSIQLNRIDSDGPRWRKSLRL